MAFRESIGRSSPGTGASAPALAEPEPHDHAHAPGHAHGAAARAPAVAGSRRRAGEWFFLASALDRMALALLLAGLIWLAVLWAMG